MCLSLRLVVAASKSIFGHRFVSRSVFNMLESSGTRRSSHIQLFSEEFQLTGCTPPTPHQAINSFYFILLLCGKLLAGWNQSEVSHAMMEKGKLVMDTAAVLRLYFWQGSWSRSVCCCIKPHFPLPPVTKGVTKSTRIYILRIITLKINQSFP